MPIIWKLKKWLALERDIYRPVELQTLLEEKAGVKLSLQALSSLINGQPSALRLQTIQALCNALDCQLSDFCEVRPDSPTEQQKRRQMAGNEPEQLYGGKKKAQPEKSIFPDPEQYTNHDEPRWEIS